MIGEMARCNMLRCGGPDSLSDLAQTPSVDLAYLGSRSSSQTRVSTANHLVPTAEMLAMLTGPTDKPTPLSAVRTLHEGLSNTVDALMA